MSRLSFVSICALVALVGACEPEPRGTTPSSQHRPANGSRASHGDGTSGLSAAQMAALRRLMSLRRQAAQLTGRRQFAAALDKLKAAMVIAPTIFGARHPFGAQIASQMAYVHEEAGSWSKAAEAYDEVLARWRRALDVKVAEPLAEALRKKGVALLRADKTSQGLAVIKRALVMWHGVAKLGSGRYGPYYMYIARGKPTGSIATCTMDLGEAYLRHRDLGQAEKYLLHAEAMTRSIRMPAQFVVQLSLNLASVYQVWGRNKRAAGYLQKMVAILAKAGSHVRKMRVKYLLRLADLHLSQRDSAATERVLGRVQKLIAELRIGTGPRALYAQIILAENHLASGKVKQGSALLKALGPRVKAAKKAHWLQTRYHLAMTRQWRWKKKRVLASMAAMRAVTASRKLRSIRPIHLLAYEAAVRTRRSGYALLYSAVAYWIAVHLGGRNQPRATGLAKAYCQLTKKLSASGVTKYLIYARAEARNAKVESTALPPCR